VSPTRILVIGIGLWVVLLLVASNFLAQTLK
jgi:hypothetical protein